MGGEVIQGIRAFSRLQLDHTAHNNWTANHSGEPAGVTKNYAADGWIETEDGPWALIEFKVSQLQSLRPRHTLAEALTGLIEAARDRAFGASHKIEVIFYGPEPKVGIEIELWAGPGRGYVEEAVYLLPNRPEGIEAVEKASAFEVTVKIDQQPIYAIADLFRYDGCDEQGYPLKPNHPWNQEGSPEDQLKRRAEIEQYVNDEPNNERDRPRRAPNRRLPRLRPRERPRRGGRQGGGGERRKVRLLPVPA